MESHLFTDYKSLLQLTSEGTETEFLNIEYNYEYDKPSKSKLMRMFIFLGNKKIIH